MGEAENGVHRRADFVAHIGQESALGLAGRFGLLSCRDELECALLHQFFEVVAMPGELFTHAFFLGDVLFNRNVMGDASVCLAQRRNDDKLRIFSAILAPVNQLSFPGQAHGQILPHRNESLARCLAGIEDARIFPEYFLAAVAAGKNEAVVHIFYF